MLPPSHCFFIINNDDYIKPPESFLGYRCIHYKEISITPSDLLILFIANNRFHQYIISFFKKPKAGVYIAWIHEPHIFQNVLDMCINNRFGFNFNDQEDYLKKELGSYLASKVIVDIKKGCFEYFFSYTLFCLKDVIEKSDLIITHSVYVKLKILFEAGIYKTIPPVIVLKHPENPKEIQNRDFIEGSKERFQIGIFGWVSPHKRIKEACKAFDVFWCSLNDEDKKRCVLKIVGELPPSEYYDPVSFVKSLNSSNNIFFTGFLDDQNFEKEFKNTDLIINLRFPSCGESSAIIHKAREFGIPIAVSDFQALREEEATEFIPVHPELEIKHLVAFLKKVFVLWKTYGTTKVIINNKDFKDSRYTKEKILKKIYKLMEFEGAKTL